MRILVVEDDQDDIDMLKEASKQRNIYSHIDFVYSGNEALEYLEYQKQQYTLPNLIVSDYNMPKMNGLDLLYAIRKQEDYAAIRFILYSTSTPQNLQQCFDAGAEAFIKKSYNFDGVLDLIDQLV